MCFLCEETIKINIGFPTPILEFSKWYNTLTWTRPVSSPPQWI